MDNTKYFPAVEDIQKASGVLEEILEPTPLQKNPNLSDVYDAQVYLKREDLQMVRSYKIRGAYNKIRSIAPEVLKYGIVCASAGNHAQGVAFSCNKLHIMGSIYMPVTTPRQKIEQVRMFGKEYIDIVLVGDTFDAANAAAIEYAKKSGKTFIPPFDDQKIIEGQGTIGYEILSQAKVAPDYVFVPIGGGGLISGIAFTLKSVNPSIKVYGVQAAGAPSMYNSVKDGKIERLGSVSTIADGIAVKKPGQNTYALCNQYVDGIVTVTDDEISAAILALMEKQKLVAEGAGAVAVAAVMFNKVPVKGKKVVCLVSGGNIDVTILSRVIKRGLLMSGRTAQLMIELVDKPGQLKNVSRIIADLGGNVISVHHERASEGSDVNGCYLRITMETRNYDHVLEIKEALKAEGFKIVE